ncbi:hypothetical protein [Novosphingobium sp. FKTRR1]|uniref:hypothetical protein n=1 Tax=Novosphingobium sp. FKTRR1 TaxID=2879118 RepID=UPI001CF01AF3|nr:hypothetical protein [Novosphingobium sp. FKTRR1]
MPDITPTDDDIMLAIHAAGAYWSPDPVRANVASAKPSDIARSIYAHACTMVRLREISSLTPPAPVAIATVPGVLRCPRCSFRLVKMTLTPSGAFANPEPDDCPNCASPLWRVTWEDEAKDAYKVAESQMDRALAAERHAETLHGQLQRMIDRWEALQAQLAEARATLVKIGAPVRWMTAAYMASLARLSVAKLDEHNG